MPPRLWKARIFAATSLDGFIARKNNDILWLTQPTTPKNPSHIPISDPKQTPTFDQHISNVDFIVMGRETFDVCLSFPEWPYPTDKNLLVLSTTLTTQSLPDTSPRRSRVVGSLDEVARILEQEGARMVYVDGGKTVQGFLRRGWIDEAVLTHAPVLLGEGRRLFDDDESRTGDVRFTLLGVDVIEGGMVTSYYRVTGSGDADIASS
ncbi:dihydrofolate reductase-like domain-containing protein [Aspergillus egyptiacus]|nr:dihydrofolate reductase-like domain-containing protein [Aspergillus egyptiacus]